MQIRYPIVFAVFATAFLSHSAGASACENVTRTYIDGNGQQVTIHNEGACSKIKANIRGNDSRTRLRVTGADADITATHHGNGSGLDAVVAADRVEGHFFGSSCPNPRRQHVTQPGALVISVGGCN